MKEFFVCLKEECVKWRAKFRIFLGEASPTFGDANFTMPCGHVRHDMPPDNVDS